MRGSGYVGLRSIWCSDLIFRKRINRRSVGHDEPPEAHTGALRFCRTAALLFHKAVVDATLSRTMPDDAKPAPIPFTVDVTVDRTRVQVTLLLRPGTAVTVAETKTTTEPAPAR